MKKLVFPVILFLLNASLVIPDEILLNNGDKLSGTILEVNTDSVSIRTAYGLIVIKRSDIRQAIIVGNAEGLTASTGSSQGTVSPQPTPPVPAQTPAPAPAPVGKWVVLLDEHFNSSASGQQWRDISSRYGDGRMQIMNGFLRLTRGNSHYGWAETSLSINRDYFEAGFTAKGVQRGDPYDRGVIYLLDSARKEIFLLEPENYRDWIRLYAYEYDSSGKASTVIICEAGYPEDDGQHTVSFRREGSEFTVFVDGKVRCSGIYTGQTASKKPEYVRLFGRGSNSGSGLDVVQVLIREYR